MNRREAICSVCQGSAMARLGYYNGRTGQPTSGMCGDWIMEDHDMIDGSGIRYGHCEGSGTTPQFLAKK